MLSTIFGNSAVRDAEHIQQVIDYRILHALWDEYSRIQSTPPNSSTRNSRRATTPVWTALTMLRSHKGNFDKFARTNLYYVEALYNCVNIYNEVADTLSHCSYSRQEAINLFDEHPDLGVAIPETFEEHRNEAVIQILIQVTLQYRELLKDFIARHGKKIEAVLKKYEVEAFDEEDYDR
jgi:hypothetical protein